MQHRNLVAILATAAATVAGAAVAPPAVAGGGGGSAITPVVAPNHLVITVTQSGEADGSYELYCAPAGGAHPEPQTACDTLRQAEDPFAPTPADALCTYMYGGPATAVVQGTWRGEQVEARFNRSNGCEIARWDELVPALPRIAGDGA